MHWFFLQMFGLSKQYEEQAARTFLHALLSTVVYTGPIAPYGHPEIE